MKTIVCAILLAIALSSCSPKLTILDSYQLKDESSGYFVNGQELTEQGMMDFTAELADRKGEGRWEKTERGWEWDEKE